MVFKAMHNMSPNYIVDLLGAYKNRQDIKINKSTFADSPKSKTKGKLTQYKYI